MKRWLEDAGSDASIPTFTDWDQDTPPPERDFEASHADFAAERAATMAATMAAVAAATDNSALDGDRLARRARIGAETLTLYQFLRGVAQHDAAHETRVRERVHPALLTEEAP